MSMTSEILLLINVTNFLNFNAVNTLYVYSGGGNLTSDDSTFAPNFTSHCDRSINGLENLHFYFNGVTMAVVVILGAVGNTLAIIVLTRRTMHTSTNVFLTALAISDNLVLANSLCLLSLSELSTPFQKYIFAYVVVYVYPAGLVAQTATVWLTVSFTVERYIAVCHPLRAASMCTIPRARLVVVAILAISIVYNIPRWFEYTVLELPDTINTTCLVPAKTQLAEDSIYHRIYFGWSYFIVMCSIPICSLTILNAFLIVAVRRSKRQRRDMNVKQSRENNVTIMLVSVVMVFIVCQVPALIYNIAYSISMNRVTESVSWSILSNIRNNLVTLNSAINFILYCALGQKFRRTFVRSLCPCLMRRLPGRFQSFSFHHNIDTQNKSSNNGNCYPKVGYKQCRADAPSEQDVALDMKVLRSKYSPRESTDSNGSVEGTELYLTNNSQRSQHKLLTPGSKSSKAS
ncbi:FMRFamide receptor [Biomphalaria pfeifferi]|uniref:FMRFamide receptor n=1 Tax=Biomphalaria pfeifferi TaxID=112525 RepID=A0AAD8BJC0_BIOPF|nr:FMRFamide receptor [Biomphalaria pfeifferi]